MKEGAFLGGMRLKILDEEKQEEKNYIIKSEDGEDSQPQDGFKIPLKLRFPHERFGSANNLGCCRIEPTTCPAN